MGRAPADALRWAREGTALLLDAAAGLTDAELAAGTSLPGWTRGHLVAHVAANAEALGNLVRWAATGVPSPMYTSPGQRAADIDRGSRLPAPELMTWLRRSAAELETAMAALTGEQWTAEVVTAQGRSVPATEIPWLRSRETYVHAVDLDRGVGFHDQPADFLAALADDVVAKRSSADNAPATLIAADVDRRWSLGAGPGAEVVASLADITAYLTGRLDVLISPDGILAPLLPPWI